MFGTSCSFVKAHMYINVWCLGYHSAKSEVLSRDMDIFRPKCPCLSHELFSKLHSARLFPFESKACKYKTTISSYVPLQFHKIIRNLQWIESKVIWCPPIRILISCKSSELIGLAIFNGRSKVKQKNFSILICDTRYILIQVSTLWPHPI